VERRGRGRRWRGLRNPRRKSRREEKECRRQAERRICGASVEINTPKTEDEESGGKGADESASVEASVGDVCHGVDQTGRKISAGAEVAVEEHVAWEEDPCSGEAAEHSEATDGRDLHH